MHLEITDVRTLKDAEPKTQRLEFHDTPNSVGAHSANTVQLADTDIGDYHAMILPIGDESEEWLYQPTTPDDGTKINGEPVAGPQPLDDGDIIEITHFQLKFILDQAPELELPEPSDLDELAKIKQFPLPERAEVRRGDEDITLSSEMQERLARFGLKLRLCQDFAQLLEETLDFLVPEIGARMVWMGVRRNPSAKLEFVAGKSEKGRLTTEPAMFDCFEYRCLSRRQYIRLPKTPDADTQSALAVPIVGEKGTLGLIIANTRRRTRVFDESDFGFLVIISRFVASQLEAIIGEHIALRHRLAGGELAFLREVQEKLDPTDVPNWPGIQLSAFAKPGSVRGGDIYDITRLPNGLAAFLLGSISGSTARTALAMTEVRTAFRIAAMHADPPHVQFKAMNWLFQTDSEPCKLAAVLLVMNPKTGAAEFSVAGNVGAIVVDDKGEARVLHDPNVPPLGETRNFDYKPARARIKPGELLALFSPGCRLVKNAAGAELGEESLISSISDGFGQPASTAMDDLKVDLAPYLRQGVAEDDVTIMLVRRAPAAS